MAEKLNQETSPGGAGCGVTNTLDLVRGKWTTRVIRELLDGPLRFGVLRERLGTISARALSETLQSMAASGLIEREFFSEMPPRTEYRLSDLGRSLMPVFDSMAAWNKGQLDETGRNGG